MKKRIISLALSLCLTVSLLSAISMPASAAGGALTSGATIQSGATYTISNAAELGYLAAIVNGGQNCAGATFQLTNNIDLLNSGYWLTYNAGGYVSVMGSGNERFRLGTGGPGYTAGHYYMTDGVEISAGTPGAGPLPFYVASANGVSIFVSDASAPDFVLDAWTPIGNDGNRFAGVFDGGGYAVNALFINSNGSDLGLFGCIDGASVQNLSVSGVITGASNSGSIAGAAFSARISNCTSSCAIAGAATIGGICGYASNTVIGDCANTGTVSGTRTVGGIVGMILVGSVTHCVNSGGISGTDSYAGGIAGGSQVSVANCYNRGDVSVAVQYSGGIVGQNYGRVENCYSTGSVSTSGQYSGGLVGYNFAIGAVESGYWLSGTADNGAGLSDPDTYLSGCGTFAADGSIAAGTAANCGTDQILANGDVLLSALNFWVVRENSASYRKWTADIGDTNDGYPVFGALHLQKVITQQPASSNDYTMSTTNAPGVMKSPQWYKFEPTVSFPATDITKTTLGWDILSTPRPGGFGMASINDHYAWTSADGVYTSGNGGDGLSYSAMSIPVDVTGGKDISFEWRVSSESGCDFLYGGLFQYNGTSGQYELVPNTKLSSLSGEVGWTARTYSGLADGTYYLAFLFFKDPMVDVGSDCGQVRLVGTDEILPGQVISTLNTAGVTPGERFRCRMSYHDGIILFSDNVTFLLPSAVPAVISDSVAKTAVTQASVSYTLTSPLTGAWNVYDAPTNGSLVAGVTADAASTTLTLSHNADVPVGTYYVSLTEAGKAESLRLGLTVTPYIPPYIPPANNAPGAPVIVNGVTHTAGTAEESTENGKSIMTVTVDTDKLDRLLAAEGNNASVIIPVSGGADVASGVLTGQMVKNMETKEAALTVRTDSGSYTLPAAEIDIDDVSKKLGEAVTLSDIQVEIQIAEPSDEVVKLVNDAATANGLAIVIPAMEYTIRCAGGGESVDVSLFNCYVERTVAVPDGVDPSRITTAVVVEPDGTTHHVPTRVTTIDGKHYAVISSLTNSTYAVVWHQMEFADAASHWAKDAINDMGSRMVVTGVGEGNYAPDKDITRAEFAVMVVRALGLVPRTGANHFSDVESTDWYSGYIETAFAYGIVGGYPSGDFGPNDKITREQAMTVIARAMKVTGLNSSVTDSEIAPLLAGHSDAADVSEYARAGSAACLKTGVILGRDDGTLAPMASITRAEVAVVIQRLLQKSNLI